MRLGIRANDDAPDVYLAHDEELFALHLHGLAGILAEQDLVARLDVERNHLALVVFLAFAHGDDFALIRFLGCGVGNDDAASGPALFLDALHDHAVVQRTDFHAVAPIEKLRCITMTWINQGIRLRVLALNNYEC